MTDILVGVIVFLALGVCIISFVGVHKNREAMALARKNAETAARNTGEVGSAQERVVEQAATTRPERTRVAHAAAAGRYVTAASIRAGRE